MLHMTPKNVFTYDKKVYAYYITCIHIDSEHHMKQTYTYQ